MQKLLLAILLSAPLVAGAAGGDARTDAMQADAETMDHDMGESGCRMCAVRGRMAGMDKGGMGAMPMRAPDMMVPGTVGPIPMPPLPDASLRQHRLAMLDLSAEQRAQIDKIQDESRRRNWDVLGKAMDAQAKLRELYAADTLDAKAIGTAYASFAKAQQQLIEAQAEAINRMIAVLTAEQREALKQPRRGMMRQGAKGGHSGMEMRAIEPIK